MQFFPSDEIINSIIKTGATNFVLPAGSKLRVGGLSHELKTTLHLDLSHTGIGGLDDGVLQANQKYFVFVVSSSNLTIGLIASLNSEKPIGCSAFRSIGQIISDDLMETSVVSSDFINKVQESQLSTIELGLSSASNKIDDLTSIANDHINKITDLQNSSSGALFEIEKSKETLENTVELLSEVKTSLENSVEELQFNTSLLSEHSSKIENIESGIVALASIAAERQSEYQSLINANNLHKKDIENLFLKFNSVLGHRHDGEDSTLLNLLDLDSEGANPGDILSVNEEGKLEWTDIPLKSSSYEIGLEWVENHSSSPVKILKSVANLAAFYCFELGVGGGGKKLFTSFKVPSNYKSGTQLKLGFLNYHEGIDVSKTYQFSCTAYLVKKGSAPGFLSLFNLSTTEKKQAFSGLKIEEEIMSLTSDDGKISSQSIMPGDLIYISLEKINTGPTEDMQKTIILTSGLSVFLKSN